MNSLLIRRIAGPQGLRVVTPHVTALPRAVLSTHLALARTQKATFTHLSPLKNDSVDNLGLPVQRSYNADGTLASEGETIVVRPRKEEVEESEQKKEEEEEEEEEEEDNTPKPMHIAYPHYFRSLKNAKGVNEAITQPEIMIQNGRNILGPKQTRAVLNSLDLTKFALHLVAAPGNTLPICKIVHIPTENEQLAEEKQKELAKMKKKKLKLLDISFASKQNDLKHKLSQVSKFLKQNYEVVHVRLVQKARRDQAPEEHKELVKRWVKEGIAQIGGMILKEVPEGKGNLRYNVVLKPIQKKKVEPESTTEPTAESTTESQEPSDSAESAEPKQ